MNPEITQGSANYDSLCIKEVEDKGIDVFANNEDDADTCSTKRLGSSAVSGDNPASDSNVSLSEHYQSDLTNHLLPSHPQRRDTKNIRHKRLRRSALARPARTLSHVSAALECDDSNCTRLVARRVSPAKEQEIRDTDQEMVNDSGTDDSKDEDYGDTSNNAASEIQGPTHSRKRAKRAKDTEHNKVETSPTHSLDVSNQAITATSSGNI